MPVTVPHEGLAQFAEAHSLQCRTGPLENKAGDGKGAAVTEPTFTHRAADHASRGSAVSALLVVVRIDVSALSHPGRVRANNEDQFFVTRLSRSLETMLSSLPAGDVPERADEVNYVMVVADGMGGHAAGEVASRLAISALVSLAPRSARLDLQGRRRRCAPRSSGALAASFNRSAPSWSSAGVRMPRCAAWDRR